MYFVLSVLGVFAETIANNVCSASPKASGRQYELQSPVPSKWLSPANKCTSRLHEGLSCATLPNGRLILSYHGRGLRLNLRVFFENIGLTSTDSLPQAGHLCRSVRVCDILPRSLEDRALKQETSRDPFSYDREAMDHNLHKCSQVSRWCGRCENSGRTARAEEAEGPGGGSPHSQARAVDTAAELLLLTAANSSRLGVLGRKRGDFFSYAKQALQYPDFACVSLRSILWRTRTELKCDPGACRLIITRAAAVATASAQLPSFLPWSGQSVQTSFDGEMCCSLWVVFSG